MLAAGENKAPEPELDAPDIPGAAVPSTVASEAAAAVPSGPRPVLAAGNDDLYWVNLLHVRSLMSNIHSVQPCTFGGTEEKRLMRLAALLAQLLYLIV